MTKYAFGTSITDVPGKLLGDNLEEHELMTLARLGNSAALEKLLIRAKDGRFGDLRYFLDYTDRPEVLKSLETIARDKANRQSRLAERLLFVWSGANSK